MPRIHVLVLFGAVLASVAAPASAVTIATIGDSYTDEYASQGYAHRNWVEQLTAYNTGIDFGPGNAFNYATAGYWSGNARSGQAPQVVSHLHQVDYVVVDVGINDFLTVAAGPTPGYPVPERYIRMGKGETALINSITNMTVGNIRNMVYSIRDEDPDKPIILSNIGDWGSTIAFRTAAIDKMIGLDFRQTGGTTKQNKALRATFTKALKNINAQLAQFARDEGIVLVNKFKLMKKAETTNPLAFAGSKKINTKFNPGKTMTEGGAYAFWADGLHPGTAWQGLYANVIAGLLKNYHGEDVAQLTARQIIASYDGSPALPGANDKIAAMWKWQDYVLLPPAGTQAKLLATASSSQEIDLSMLTTAWDDEALATGGHVTAIPEPGAGALLVSALVLLGVRRRR